MTFSKIIYFVSLFNLWLFLTNVAALEAKFPHARYGLQPNDADFSPNIKLNNKRSSDQTDKSKINLIKKLS